MIEVGSDALDAPLLGHALAHWSSVWVTFEALPTTAVALPADEPVLGPGGGNPMLGSTAPAWAEAVFVWLTPSDAPGLAIRTETLTLVGDVCVVFAFGATLAAASPPTPVDAFADASFVCVTAPSLPALFTRTDRLTFDGAFWSAAPFACAACVPSPVVVADPVAVAAFNWSTEPLAPACPTRAETFVFDAASWLEIALASACELIT